MPRRLKTFNMPRILSYTRDVEQAQRHEGMCIACSHLSFRCRWVPHLSLESDFLYLLR